MELKQTIQFPIERQDDLGESKPYPSSGVILEQDTIIKFPEGVLAFEDSKRFVLLFNSDIQPFGFLKSLDVKDLGFICIDPFLVYPDYFINLSSQNVSVLDLKDPCDALVISFVTVSQDPRDTTANLLAPIVINTRNFTGKQIILENYPVQYKIWQAIEKLEQIKEG